MGGKVGGGQRDRALHGAAAHRLELGHGAPQRQGADTNACSLHDACTPSSVLHGCQLQRLTLWLCRVRVGIRMALLFAAPRFQCVPCGRLCTSRGQLAAAASTIQERSLTPRVGPQSATECTESRAAQYELRAPWSATVAIPRVSITHERHWYGMHTRSRTCSTANGEAWVEGRMRVERDNGAQQSVSTTSLTSRARRCGIAVLSWPSYCSC
jgi:hypothetical protein